MNVPAHVDLAVVGAGPAGRALAHRAVAAGLAVAVIDPAPDTPWRATYGMFVDDLPGWITRDALTRPSSGVVVYTPDRRVVGRPYVTLRTDILQRSLTLDGAAVIVDRASRLTATGVDTESGTRVSARCVVDARGGRGADPGAARQTASGVFLTASTDRRDVGDETVLMDWRHASADSPSFSYRVPTPHGYLVEETCLAGRPPIDVDELGRRTGARLPSGVSTGRLDHEFVDFPLDSAPRPWSRGTRAALAFGAAGGLMHPATGYSVAPSLAAVDTVVAAVVAGRDPRRALWPCRARWVHRLRSAGLEVLLALDGPSITAFFDAFFRLPGDDQRAFLSERGNLAGVVRTMVRLYATVPGELRSVMRRRTIASLVHRAP
ncbi:lycopene cyclase family protein [Gordonia shandongensis]|uniref:lycopene cyclase family protein n=1 Tax=Gordonia shandongensis TaxID=376351 RepID=UPI00040FD709|nr:lycopene cyclase family protein [Gordonia shandongensis]